MYRDGNGNGIRQADTVSGVDPPLGARLRLRDWFAGTSIRIARPLPPVDEGAMLTAGSDAVRLSGGGSILSSGPTGTMTSGTVYVAGGRREAFAIRVLGPTGRVRLFEYRMATDRWQERW